MDGVLRRSAKPRAPRFVYGILRTKSAKSNLAVNVVARGRRGGTSSAVDGRRGAVLLVADVLAPPRGVAFVVDLHHSYVGHEAVRVGELRNATGEHISCRSATGHLLQLFGVPSSLHRDL